MRCNTIYWNSVVACFWGNPVDHIGFFSTIRLPLSVCGLVTFALGRTTRKTFTVTKNKVRMMTEKFKSKVDQAAFNRRPWW